MSSKQKRTKSPAHVVFEPFEHTARPVPLAKQPLGLPLKGREALEFMAAMANLNPVTLRRTGEPNAERDLGHIDGVCYAVCRFAQVENSSHQQLRAAAYRNPAETLGLHLASLKELVSAVADGEDRRLRFSPAPEIVVFGKQLHEPQRKKQPGLPFFFRSERFSQALVLTAVFYLGLMRESRLLKRCVDKECGKVFVATRETKKFCSTTCSSRATSRASRERYGKLAEQSRRQGA
jgi:hypothetical protein